MRGARRLKLMARLLGLARVEILGAEPELLLNRCGNEGLSLRKIQRTDAVTILAELWERDLPALRALAASSGCEVRVTELLGGSRSRARMRARKLLLLALGLAAGLLLGSSLFVWEIEVRGCEALSQGQVLRVLADCGVEQGSFWPALSIDLVRSRMLTELPELAWMTVNISGSRAVVLIQERAEKPEIYREDQAADVVASRSGVIRSMTVLNGYSLVQPGDAVLEGELLVSGRMESLTGPGRSVRAAAQIQVDTWHELTAVCPLEMLQQLETGHGHSHFSLQIGKKRIKWGSFPGKGLDECDKIVHEYSLGVEGLFAMPVTLIREERRGLSPTGAQADREEDMKAALLRRLEGQIDGEILDQSFSVSRADGLLVVTLRAHCCENIAQTAEMTP